MLRAPAPDFHVSPTAPLSRRQVYEELDESLTKAFEDFLRERGVDEALGAYLVEAVHDKEQREYQAWLERVQTFLQAK